MTVPRQVDSISTSSAMKKSKAYRDSIFAFRCRAHGRKCHGARVSSRVTTERARLSPDFGRAIGSGDALCRSRGGYIRTEHRKRLCVFVLRHACDAASADSCVVSQYLILRPAARENRIVNLPKHRQRNSISAISALCCLTLMPSIQ